MHMVMHGCDFPYICRVTGNQNAYFEGLFLSSSTIATAMTNLIPAITFVMAATVG